MLKFDKPTLVTLTAPTCSGKSYLLNALTERGLFSRIVSTTTRPMRSGEKEGFDYNFISWNKSQQLEEQEEFFELIEFNKTRYGVTNDEMNGKMASAVSPAIVLEPQGLAIYERECRERGWDVYKVYVHVTENIRIERLLQRTLNEAWGTIENLPAPTPGAQAGRYDRVFHNVAVDDAKKSLAKTINEHQRRLLSITGPERSWSNTTLWDAIIPGDNVDKAIAMLEHGVRWRNRQRAEPQATGRVDLPR